MTESTLLSIILKPITEHEYNYRFKQTFYFYFVMYGFAFAPPTWQVKSCLESLKYATCSRWTYERRVYVGAQSISVNIHYRVLNMFPLGTLSNLNRVTKNKRESQIKYLKNIIDTVSSLDLVWLHRHDGPELRLSGVHRGAGLRELKPSLPQSLKYNMHLHSLPRHLFKSTKLYTSADWNGDVNTNKK